MTARTLGRRLLLHIALRLVAATVLLGAALVVELRAPSDFAVNPFFALIARRLRGQPGLHRVAALRRAVPVR